MLFGKKRPVKLPTDYIRNSFPSFKGKHIYFTIDKEKLKAVNNLVNKLNVTKFTLFLAIFKLSLYYFSKQETISIGIFVSSQLEQTNDMLGLFGNKIFIQSKILPNVTVEDFINQELQSVLKAISNSNFPAYTLETQNCAFPLIYFQL